MFQKKNMQKPVFKIKLIVFFLIFFFLVSNETELGEKIFSIGENDDDHKPHQLFCEMDELENGNCEWKEAARWLKFEEVLFLLVRFFCKFFCN